VIKELMSEDKDFGVPLQHGRLLPEGSILCLKSDHRLERGDQQPEQEAPQRATIAADVR
jgi:hypothetical protein